MVFGLLIFRMCVTAPVNITIIQLTENRNFFKWRQYANFKLE